MIVIVSHQQQPTSTTDNWHSTNDNQQPTIPNDRQRRPTINRPSKWSYVLEHTYLKDYFVGRRIYVCRGFCSAFEWLRTTGCRPPPPSSTRGKAGRNKLNEEITSLLPTGIGERFSPTISNLGHAALLRRCELPHGRRNFKDTNPLMSSLLVTLFGVVKQFRRF